MKKSYFLWPTIAGILFFLVYNDFIFITLHKPSLSKHINKQTYIKKIILYYQTLKKKREEESIFFYNNENELLNFLIHEWLLSGYKNQFFTKKISVENAYFFNNNKECVISFSDNFLIDCQGAYERFLILSSFFRTINKAFPKTNTFFFMIHQNSFYDDYIDFSEPLEKELFM